MKLPMLDQEIGMMSQLVGLPKVLDKQLIIHLKIHYLIDQYSGVIGDIILPMTTPKYDKGDWKNLCL